jgi:hypothetical protein
VTVVSQLLPDRQESLSEIKKYLNELLLKSPAFGLESHPLALKEWIKIWDKLIKKLDRDSNDSTNSFRKTANHYNSSLKEVECFEVKYSDFVNESFNIYKDTLIVFHRIDSNFYEFAKEIQKNKKIYYQAKSIKKWLRFIDENIVEYIYERSLPVELVEIIAGTLYGISEVDFLRFLPESSVKKSDKILFRDMIASVDQYLKKFRKIQAYLFKNLSAASTDVNIARSAEEKALERIRESKGDTSNWETVIQPGQTIDLEVLSSWLEVNGFAQ